MKILAITDLHGSDAALEAILDAAGPADMVLLGGDITNFGSPGDVQRLVARIRAEGLPLWAVAGNCDSPEIDRRLVELGISLHARGVVHQGVGLHGLSAMPPWRPGMYQFTEVELAEMLQAGHRQIAGAKRHVVLSHAPPHGKLDRVAMLRHVGSTALADFIRRTQPALVLCGHVHEGRGVDSVGPTVIANCGAARSGHFAIADVPEEGEVKVVLERA